MRPPSRPRPRRRPGGNDAAGVRPLTTTPEALEDHGWTVEGPAAACPAGLLRAPDEVAAALDVVLERARTRSGPGARDDDLGVCTAIEGGGSRGLGASLVVGIALRSQRSRTTRPTTATTTPRVRRLRRATRAPARRPRLVPRDRPVCPASSTPPRPAPARCLPPPPRPRPSPHHVWTALPFLSAGRGRGSSAKRWTPFLESPGVERDLGPGAGRRPVRLLRNTKRRTPRGEHPTASERTPEARPDRATRRSAAASAHRRVPLGASQRIGWPVVAAMWS